jgi:ABC-2 type transport system ATP-binding protein
MNTILDCKGLDVRFRKKRVLVDLDLQLADGATTVLLGGNGAGKSTLLRVLLGVLRPRAGTVRIFGKDPLRAHREVLQRIGYVPDVPDCPGWMTARDLFTFLRPQYSTWNDTLCARLAEELAVPMRTKFASMSRGQGMKAMLVAALAPEPQLLLLDEPFAGLDADASQRLVATLAGLPRSCTLVVFDHRRDCLRCCDRVLVLAAGQLAPEAAP